MTKTIRTLATIAGVIVGVTSYLVLALQLFWEEHGETVQYRFSQFVHLLTESIELTYKLGKDCGEFYYTVGRPWLAGKVDSLFYTAIDV
jgi:hypothetical protein